MGWPDGLLAALGDQLAIGVVAIDAQRRITLWNAGQPLRNVRISGRLFQGPINPSLCGHQRTDSFSSSITTPSGPYVCSMTLFMILPNYASALFAPS